MIRTGYSFRQAAGSIDEVISRLEEIGSKYAPISDTSSTFGFIRWQKAAIKAGMKPVFGVELGVSTDRQEKGTRWDKWTFIAKDSVRPINDLLTLATSQFRFVPMLSIEQAYSADCFKIIGSNPYWVNDEDFDWVVPSENLFVSLSPASSKYATSILLSEGFKFVAMSDNRYPRESDSGFYEVLTGRNASMQTYPQHILSDDEWRKSVAHLGLPENVIESAIKNRDYILESSTAKLRKAELPIIEWPKTIRQLCEEGAVKLNCDIEDPVYKQRLEFELEMIHSKGFQDYFQIVAELVTWARARMSVGPARGSSCGSLVCYLTQITTIDPIPYGLLFARFLDFQRMDFPDIDIDFSDTNRYMVFEHLKEKYGEDKVARLGTVAMFQPRSALSEVGMSLRIPKWKCDAVAESLLERSSGDARALQTLEDTMTTMPAGIRLMEDHPEAKIMTRFEGHPRHSGIHAAGVVIASEPINEYSAVDSLSGATQCDKKDAEDGFGLLKIDALGLTQLSIFEEALHLAGLPMDALEHIPLDDDEAFKVLRDKRYSGIFQFNGMALQSISNQIVIDRLDDIINITALARPGPLANGGAHEWVRRRNGTNPVKYPHPLFEPFTNDSLGIIIFQEQVMMIGREVGNLSWDTVTQLRKAMSKSLGAEYFDQFGDPWKAGARANGITDEAVLKKTWDDLCSYGSWSFNKSHSVAYGLISYQCCWLKAHYPFEFAAATLTHQDTPDKQIMLLREMVAEGYDYLPVAKEISTNKWSVAVRDESGKIMPVSNVDFMSGNSMKERILVGPLSSVKGIGPKLSKTIISDRDEGKFSKRAEKIFENPTTPIDSLFPIRDAFKKIMPDPEERNILTKPTQIGDIVDRKSKLKQYPALVFCTLAKINTRDENEAVNVAKRGYEIKDGMTTSLNLQLLDDTGQVFGKISRKLYRRFGQEIVDRGGVGKHLYAIKGTIKNESFIMMMIEAVRYIGEVGGEYVSEADKIKVINSDATDASVKA